MNQRLTVALLTISTLALTIMALTLLGALLPKVALAGEEEFQSTDSIRSAAEGLLAQHPDIQNRANTTINIGKIDTRLTLPTCGSPLETFLPSSAKIQSKTTVGVRCTTPRPWTLYVSANITTISQVLVATTYLQRGHVINADDISLKSRNASQLNTAYLNNPEQIIGKVLKRNLASNAVFTSAILTEPQIIKKGQRVDLQAGKQGLMVSVTAIALASGAVGERIRVQNLSSSKIVEGTILASGVIQAD